jgi:hypothetical protein
MGAATEQARALAVAVVTTALELHAKESGALHERLLAAPRVQSALPLALVNDPSAQRQLLSSLAVTLARAVLEGWLAHYPDQQGPEKAVLAAEAWAACPCAVHAEAAAAAQPSANQQSQAAWNRRPKEAAWAGRTASWVADAPKHGWQAVSAITGACKATNVDQIVAVATAFLAVKAFQV